jgi:hypothetical protein
MKSRLLVPLLGLALACAPRLLPNSDIKDTPDTRAIATLLETYRQAMEAGDAKAVLALVSPRYLDSAGTPDPSDDVDLAGLSAQLAELSKVTSLRLQVTLRRVEVKGEQAEAEVYFDQWYKVTTAAGPIPRHDADVHRMALRKLAGTWKFESGL